MKTCFLVALVFMVTAQLALSDDKHSYNPPKGFVPDEQTAIKIAVAVWEPIYGEKEIKSEYPLKASLEGGVWTVMGSLPPGWRGGVAVAEISQKDGRILRVSHGK